MSDTIVLDGEITLHSVQDGDPENVLRVNENTTNHASLINRNSADQHSIASITGLTETIEEVKDNFKRLNSYNLAKSINVSERTTNGVTYSITGKTANFSGTASSVVNQTIEGSTSTIPSWIKPGTRYRIRLNKTGESPEGLLFGIAAYRADSSGVNWVLTADDELEFTTPDDISEIVGVIVRYRVSTGSSVDCSCYLEIYENLSNKELEDTISSDVLTFKSLSPSSYQYLVANVKDNVISVLTENQHWEDIPITGIFTNQKYSINYNIQTIETTHPNRATKYVREVNRNTGAVYKDWMKVYDIERIKILAIGDSICRGGRNSGKGFVGDLGYPYINMGVGGATISSVRSTYDDSLHHYEDANNIPNQLIVYQQKTNAEILETFGIEKFTPDVIIAEGGINDYIYGAELGVLSSYPVTTSEEAELLDRNTLIGALEYLFFQMVNLYSNAQRFFVITHKTARPNGQYYPTLRKSGGYNQLEMHDALVNCCKMYGVIPIDVYMEGIMDTKFSQYKTTSEHYSQASSTDYCDYDGVHPLDYGYKQVYKPLIEEALRKSATRK